MSLVTWCEAPAQPDRSELLAHPCFIAEVATPSAASIDRREKRASTRSSSGSDALYGREGSGWRGHLLNQSDDVPEASCLGLRLTLEQIYAGVEFPPTGVSEPNEADYVAGVSS